MFSNYSSSSTSFLQLFFLLPFLPYFLNIANSNSGIESHIITSKQSRNSFKSQVSPRTTKPLEVIYTNVCGPLEVHFLGGNNYFVTFKDDFTRKLCIVLLKRKNEVFNKFISFKAMAEKQCGNKLKLLRSDGGGEYVSHEFHSYCDKEGITHEIVVPYTPQHNGITDRVNSHVLNMARSMLKTKKLPNKF